MGFLSRRQLLVASSIGMATMCMSKASVRSRMRDQACSLTPIQTEGPFYPVDDHIDENNDLTRVTGNDGVAEGQPIFIAGRVKDSHCRPIEGVRVEIWQASAKGRYRHPADRNNPVPLDPYFQGWGETISDAEGGYLFKTIHPGRYPAGPGWVRPSHIHFKVVSPRIQELTTQMYFAGDPFLSKDRIFLAVPTGGQARVIANSVKSGPPFDPGAKVYQFDLIVDRGE